MDDVNQLWSWGLAAVGVSGVYLTTKKLYAGYVVGVLVQVLWISYAVSTRQWGFIASALAFGWVNALGWYRWTRNASAPASDIPTTKVSQEAVTFRLPPVNTNLIDDSGAFKNQADATRRHFEEES